MICSEAAAAAIMAGRLPGGTSLPCRPAGKELPTTPRNWSPTSSRERANASDTTTPIRSTCSGSVRHPTPALTCRLTHVAVPDCACTRDALTLGRAVATSSSSYRRCPALRLPARRGHRDAGAGSSAEVAAAVADSRADQARRPATRIRELLAANYHVVWSVTRMLRTSDTRRLYPEGYGAPVCGRMGRLHERPGHLR